MYYITQYALTQGILYVPDQQVEELESGLLVVRGTHNNVRLVVQAIDWFKDRQEAETRFNQIKQRKIASLKKKLNKTIRAEPIYKEINKW